jgi:hypothetical protein
VREAVTVPVGVPTFFPPKIPLSHSFIEVEVEKGAIQARWEAKKGTLFHIEELVTGKTPSLQVS